MRRILQALALFCVLALARGEARAVLVGFHEASTAGANAATVTVNVPANVRAGDVMLAVLTVRNTAAVTAPAAWTPLRADSAGTTMRQHLFYRVVTGAEPASYSWTITSARAAASILAYRGVDTASPVDVHGGQSNASSTTVTAPSVNATVANGMLVTFLGNAATTTITPAAPLRNRAGVNSGGGTGVSLAIGDETRASSGATGTRTGTAGTGAVSVGQSVVLRRASTAPSPVAEYRFDETSWTGSAGEVTDSSGNGLNGQSFGGAQTTTTNARLCRSGSFTGSPTYAEVANNARLNIRSTLTVTAWIRPASIPASELMSFLSKDDNYEFHVASNGRVNWWWGGGSQELFSPNNTVAANQWTFVAFVFTRGAQAMYAGGVSSAATVVASGTDAAQLAQNALPLQIADDQSFGGGSRRWNGLLDEIRIYDTALDAAEIEAVRTSTRTCPSLLASFEVTSGAGASTCVAQPVTIRARDSLGNTLVTYNGTVNLTTSTGTGGWSASGSSGPVTENGNANDGIASYTFRAADNGQATLLLGNQAASNLTVAVADSVNTSATGVSGVIAFRDNAFVVEEDPSSLVAGAGVAVAGRPHDMRVTLWRRDITQTPANCAVADGYAGLRSLKAWLSLDGAHPAGATAPGIDATAPGVDLAAVPAALHGANNLQLNFVAGVATFNLTSADVGKYVLNLRDDSRNFANAVDITGSSTTLTVRPFAIAVTAVSKGATTNPGGSATAGGGFVAAGDTFSATVGAYLWNAADDANNDGVPDATTTNVVNNGLVPRFAWPVTLTPGSAASPFFSPSGGVLGALTGTTTVPQIAFSAGAATVTDLRYSEAGSMALSAALTGYLGTAGVDLAGVAVDTAGQPVRVGRFYPERFTLLAGAAVTPFCGGATGFTYMDQPALGLSFTVEARNAQDVRTQNYRSAGYAVGSVSVVAENADAGVNLGGRLSGVPVGTWIAGSYAINAPATIFTRLAAPDGPFDSLVLGVVATDADGARLVSRDMNAATAGACGGGCDARALNSGSPVRARFGRLQVGNALGSPLLPLPVPLTLEYWNGSGFVRNALDSCTTLLNTRFTFAGYSAPLAACNTSGTPAGAITFSGGAAATFRLSPPGVRGSVDLTANLGSVASGQSCSGGSAVAATAANQPWLQGNWGGAVNWNQNPTGRAAFGQYTNAQELIYRREQY